MLELGKNNDTYNKSNFLILYYLWLEFQVKSKRNKMEAEVKSRYKKV
jgi:hypothetical protein